MDSAHAARSSNGAWLMAARVKPVAWLMVVLLSVRGHMASSKTEEGLIPIARSITKSPVGGNRSGWVKVLVTEQMTDLR
ncbi:MAG: hypothetical protein P4M09_23550 [Devosia sp.]|nr:hypothetical protein [Devosia sp.]